LVGGWWLVVGGWELDVTIPEPRDVVRQAVVAWEGVRAGDHRFGGIEFRIGRRELGHLHQRFADLPFPRSIRDELVSSGRAVPHHILPESGWVTVPMRTPAEVANVIALFRLAYDRAVGPSSAR